MSARLLAIFLAVSVAALAGGGDFDHLVKAVESHYGVRRTHIPFMGVANVALKVKHPAGASEFQLAVLEDLDSSPVYHDPADRDRLMNTVSGHGLYPMIAMHSRRDAQSTYMFMAEAGKSTKMLIAIFHGSGATIIQFKADMNVLLKSLEDPEGMAESLSGGLGQ